MFLRSSEEADGKYAFVVVGTGFGSLFFVHELMRRQPETRVLMLERGSYRPWDRQLADRRNSDIASSSTYLKRGSDKEWNFTVAYGGGTNCWFGSTPRFLPSDFRMKSLYGRGQDWPVPYEGLEPFYLRAEQVMDISGPDDYAQVCPRSAPYPQPAHRFSSVDEVLKKAQPDLHFVQPTARARIANAQRNQCCASAQCQLCPADAKFTALNGFRHLSDHPNVHILTGAEAWELDRTGGNTVSAVRYRAGGREHRVGCDFCVLGANAIHSPAILARSPISHPLQGRGLNEQLGFAVEAMLDGVDNFDGSTISTGINYSLYDGAFRRSYGAAYIITDNRPTYGLRLEYGRWRQLLVAVVAVEDELRDDNLVDTDEEGRAVVNYAGASDYALEGVKEARRKLPDVLAPLPVEKIEFMGFRATESHLQGTLRTGSTRQDSVVDADLVHHDLRNLAVVGTAAFSTCPPANPSLTAAALSIRAADRLLS